MRIIGGRFRGTKLADVGEGDADAHLRPTADRTREAVFNMLTQGRFGDRVTGARVLDLFAGTGAMALEALKLLTGFGTPLAGRLLMLDARRMAFDEIQVARQKDCPVCGPVQSRPETPDA